MDIISKVIKTEDQYNTALIRAEELIDLMPKADSKESEELELLSVLIKNYENEHYQILPPDPIEAIKFRMEQENLNQRDLIPYIGSRVKVSEVLNRKRPLTIKMIRALHDHFYIPYESLLNETDFDITENKNGYDWSKLPFLELTKRGCFNQFERLKDYAEEVGTEILNTFKRYNLTESYFKQNLRKGADINTYSLMTWKYDVIIRAEEKMKNISGVFSENTIDDTFMKRLTSFNILPDGPQKAIDFLFNYGIIVVAVPHFRGTHLDGACFSLNKIPVIALTLRYDRIDNFWFVLLHELAHLKNDLYSNNNDVNEFIDDLEVSDVSDIEKRADSIALEWMIKKDDWDVIYDSLIENRNNIDVLSKEYIVHPAIIAGRFRKAVNNFMIFSKIVTDSRVRDVIKQK